MWVRKRIDLKPADLGFAMGRCLQRGDPEALGAEIEAGWSERADAVSCLSVRSGFDLLLQSLALPAGSEVLMSAVTIPDMVRIVRHHQLVPVPLDLDMQRLAPRPEACEAAITPATRAIVIAHLFGSRVPMEPLIELARRHRLLLIEDAAQAFVGPSFRGAAASDAVLFSFGPIKSATALGGGMLQIPDDTLRADVRRRQDQYVRQSNTSYLQRLLKFAAIKGLSGRYSLAAVASVCRVCGQSHDALANRLVKGFAGGGLIERIRRRPSAPLLALMQRQFERYSIQRAEQRRATAEQLTAALRDPPDRPGRAASDHSYWVYPVIAAQPALLLNRLWAAGFDATQGASHGVVPVPEGSQHAAASEAARVGEQTVFLPCDPRMSPSAIRRMAEVVREHAGDPSVRELAPNASVLT